MKKIFENLTESQLLAEAAKRKMLLARANRKVSQDIQAKLKAHAESLVGQSVTAEDMKSIQSFLQDSFVYTPSAELATEIEAIKTEAYSVLPKEIATERVQYPVCDCAFHAIADHSDYGMDKREVFLIKKCEAHAMLSTEVAHDTLVREQTLFNTFMIVLGGQRGDVLSFSEEYVNEQGVTMRRFKPDVVVEGGFEGEGKNRKLNAVVKGGDGSLEDLTAAVMTEFKKEYPEAKDEELTALRPAETPILNP